LKHLALLAIHLYQRWLSPLKGFSCAYRIHTGAQSCSHLGFRAIRRYGLLGGSQVLRIRLALCSDCYEERQVISARRRAQLGSCDAPCDLPCGIDVCDCLECADCDWGRKKGQEANSEGAH
jgi:uncharacterized protein